MKALDYIDNKCLFVLGKGNPGDGKSIAISSWLEQGPMFFFDFDGKIKAIINFWKKHNKALLNNLEFEHYDDYNKAAKKLESFIDDGHPYTGGVVIDTLTTGVDSILTQIHDVKGGSKKVIGGIAVNEIEDYNAESSALTRLVQDSKFKLHKNLNTNFFMLAHVVAVESHDLKSNSKVVTRQLVTAGKKVAAKLPGYFDEIWHFYTESAPDGNGKVSQRYKVTTQATGVDFARTSCNLPVNFDVTYPGRTLYQQVKAELDVMPLGESKPLPTVPESKLVNGNMALVNKLINRENVSKEP